MKNITGSIQAELIKLKKSGVLWLAIAGTLVTNLLFTLAAIYLPDLPEEFKSNPLQDWHSWIAFHYEGIMTMLLPMFLVILCALSVLMENRNNTWKALYSLPIRKSVIYLSKLKVIISLFLVSHLLFVFVLMLFPLIINHSFKLSLEIINHVISLYAGTITSSLGILGIVYWVSYFSRSFILPLIVGILGFVLAQLMIDYNLDVRFFPFSYPVVCIEALLDGKDHQIIIYLYSIAMLIIISLLGMIQSDKDYRKFY